MKSLFVAGADTEICIFHFVQGKNDVRLGVLGDKAVFIKTVMMFITAFFIFCGPVAAAVSESDNYKLYASIIDGGGGPASSSSYNSTNSAGSTVATANVSGSNYKIFSGELSTINSIPEAAIISYNDGKIIADVTPTLSWTYEDKDNDTQRYYHVHVSKDNFVTNVVDTGLVESSDNDYTTENLPVIEQGETYRWRVRVSDGFDYSGWYIATNGFRLTITDLETPIVWAKVSATGLNISERLWQRQADPYMYWEYSVEGIDIAGYSYIWGSIPDDNIDTNSTSYQTPQDLLADGIRVFYLKGQNTAGTWTDTTSFEIWIDRAGPIIGAYSPGNSAIIDTDTPTISIKVIDVNSGVNPDSIVMKINKSTVEASYDTDGQKVICVPSISLSEGDNVVSFEASDFVGNKTDLLVWSFVVDTIKPAGTIIINNQDAVTNSVYVNLDLSASDVTSGITDMIISNDGVFDTERWQNFAVHMENWILPAVSGTKRVYVKFRDTAGNESRIFSDTIELIIIAPDTIITSGPSGQTKSAEALWTFKATVQGSVFRWKFDGEEWPEWSTKDSVTRGKLTEGNHYFKVQAAKDVNGNGEIDIDEIDPVPEERTWTISEEGVVSPDLPKKRPLKFWKEE